MLKDALPSNAFCARLLGVITLSATGNGQGNYHSISFATGLRVLHHQQWTSVPISDSTIACIEGIAKH
jgi:hypothetical protein